MEHCVAADAKMSGSTENHKHVRRRLEPLRMAAMATPRTGGPRVCVSVVEAFGVQYRGAMLYDAGMDWSCAGKKPYLANRFVEECIRLSQLRHPNLAMLYGIAMDGTSLTLVTDRPADSLDECLCRYEAIPEFMKTSILLDAARGLLYLHKQKPAIAHTGVSTKTVYVSPSMRAKIGDVGVAGALSERAADDVARNTTSRLPPEAFVSALEMGSNCTNTQVDIPAFGNVIVHTVRQLRWLDPPGHTAVSPYLHTMSGHPLYSLAYYCLQGGGAQGHTGQQLVPQLDMDGVVQSLQHTDKSNPPPFRNTLELFQALLTVEQNFKQLQGNNPSSPLQNHNSIAREPVVQDRNAQVPGHIISMKWNVSTYNNTSIVFPP